jgi:hypothetical protein
MIIRRYSILVQTEAVRPAFPLLRPALSAGLAGCAGSAGGTRSMAHLDNRTNVLYTYTTDSHIQPFVPA